MKTAVFSDIHGNCVGLDAVLEDVKRHPVDQWVCLGDALQGGTQPAAVIERLRELACPVVLGNADDWVATGKVEEGSPEIVSEGMLEVRDWTLEQIGDDGIAFIQSFVSSCELDIAGDLKLLCFHGSPRSHSEVLLPETPDSETAAPFDGVTAQYLTGGHTHLQWIRSIGGATFFNPGSVGVAYNRHLSREEFYIYPIAEYAVIGREEKEVSIEFCRVPFDVDRVEKAAVASGHPYADREASRFRPRN